ncbi:MAG: hypothetical protein U1E26_03790 [Coriobacteriia bacterium]|nr:hypothetical protein [Coriobacteriia bacterium]
MRLLRYAAVAALALLCAVGVACVPENPVPAGSSAPLAIEPMTPSAKRATIATSFPAEVPVPVGDFTRAQAQGDDAWDYVVEVPNGFEDLVQWYRAAYLGRQWEQVGEEAQDSTGRKTVLMFRKGNAESSVTVTEGESGGPVSASVTLGIGAPVLLTQ